MIGCGGFGKVYKYSDQVAVKEEFKVHNVIPAAVMYVVINLYLP